MTTTDWIINIALVAVVLLQMKQRRLTWHAMLLPLGGVAYAATTYLTAIPTAGNDLLLIGAAIAAGATLGIAGGLTTTVARAADGTTRFRASVMSAGLWVLGTGARLAFIIWLTHGGGAALGRFSVAHHITGSAAWTDALILMVLAEVVVRTGTIVARAARTVAAPASPRPVLAGAR
jgi:hypothetical protein